MSLGPASVSRSPTPTQPLAIDVYKDKHTRRNIDADTHMHIQDAAPASEQAAARDTR